MGTATEPEWDSRISNLYQDGYEAYEADARSGREPGPLLLAAKPRPWREGYEQAREDMKEGTDA
jgi:hypothetical protein